LESRSARSEEIEKGAVRQSCSADVHQRLRSSRQKRRQQAAERATTLPDMESYAEGAAFRQAVERSVRDP
jgi:hypothetical protein